MSARLPIGLLALACFLAPLLGGYVSAEAMPLAPGLGSLLTSLTSPEAPIAAHFVIALPVFLATALVLVRRSVLSVPPGPFLWGLMLLALLMLISVPVSAFPGLSVNATAAWLTKLFAALAVIAIVGRRQGPLLLVTALVASIALVAMIGILEYAETKATDPSWRIFSLWMNPNALAGILIPGALLALGLAAQRERIEALVAGLAAAVMLFALVLTQSKGGFLAMGIGLIVLLVASVLSGTFDGRRLGRWILALVLTAALSFGLRFQQTGPEAAQPGVFTRIEQAEATAEQSGEFRANLYRGAIELMRRQPVGYGMGTYREESARPGLTTKTVMAHNSYLQLGVEAGILAMLTLLGIGFYWLARTLKGWRRGPESTRYLRAGVLAAVAGIASHAVVDSDLHYFGIGFVFFVLLGLGLCLASDGPSPELLSKPTRWSALAVTLALLGILGLNAQIDIAKAHLRYHMATGDGAAARSTLETLRTLAPRHGDVWYWRALVLHGGRGAAAIADLAMAADLMPTGRHLRALARAQEAAGEITDAALTLREALRRDPNDLSTLEQLRRLHMTSGNLEGAIEIAQRMIAVEDTPYFRVRSLPEVVPTETYFARLFLAEQTDDLNEKIHHWEIVLSGFGQYRMFTIPPVLRILSVQPDGAFAGQDRERAAEVLRAGEDTARRLSDAYQSRGDDEAARVAESEAGAFVMVLSELLETLANSSGTP